jgi:outer membrane protein OmpA-like peptidoglycan-associated protein
MESITGTLSPRLLERIAGKSGAEPSTIRGQVGGICASLVDSLAGKSNDTRTMGSLAELVNERPDEVEDLDRTVDDENAPLRQRGNRLLNLVTPDVSGMQSRVAGLLGIGAGAARGVLGTIAALVLAGMRRFARGRTLDGNTLATMLRSERGSLRGFAVPTAPAAPPVMTEPRVVGDGKRVYSAGTAREVAPTHRGRGWGWLILVPLALLAIWLYQRGHHGERYENRPGAAARHGETMRRHGTLPTFASNTPEAKLVGLLNLPGAPHMWVDLDSVKFENGSANLDPSSNSQLAHVAEILRAYPDARIKIVGQAEATGTAETNLALSKERAEAVKQVLIAQGISSSRIDAEGYGVEAAVQGTTGEHRGVSVLVER